MASRWRSAFISLFFVFMGILGMVGLVMDTPSKIPLGSLTVEAWKVYAFFSALGFIMSGYAIAGILRRQPPEGEEDKVDELEEEVEGDIFQLEP